MSSFSITTDLTDQDWQECARLRWSNEHDVRGDVLLANVTITVAGQPFLRRIGLALVDFVFGLFLMCFAREGANRIPAFLEWDVAAELAHYV
jgi:hypothetical protein